MSRVIRLLLHAYPSGWRKRYGPELEALTTDVGLSPVVAVDLVRSGLRERAAEVSPSRGGIFRFGLAWRHPAGFAWLAALVMAPTALFVAGSLMAYQLGLVTLRGVMDSVGAWLDGAGPISAVLLFAAPVSVALALAPLTSVEGRGSGLGLRIIVAPRAANFVVAGMALVVTAVLAWYGAGEIGPGG